MIAVIMNGMSAILRLNFTSLGMCTKNGFFKFENKFEKNLFLDAIFTNFIFLEMRLGKAFKKYVTLILAFLNPPLPCDPFFYKEFLFHFDGYKSFIPSLKSDVVFE